MEKRAVSYASNKILIIEGIRHTIFRISIVEMLDKWS